MLLWCAAIDLSSLLGIDVSERIFKSGTLIILNYKCGSSESFCLKQCGEHTEMYLADLDICVTESAIFFQRC